MLMLLLLPIAAAVVWSFITWNVEEEARERGYL